jgi:hypothetical protein
MNGFIVVFFWLIVISTYRTSYFFDLVNEYSSFQNEYFGELNEYSKMGGIKGKCAALTCGFFIFSMIGNAVFSPLSYMAAKILFYSNACY